MNEIKGIILEDNNKIIIDGKEFHEIKINGKHILQSKINEELNELALEENGWE